MNIFKDVIFSWWQIGLLKFSLLAIGLAIGSHFADSLEPYFWHLLIIGFALGLYLTMVWWRQP